MSANLKESTVINFSRGAQCFVLFLLQYRLFCIWSLACAQKWWLHLLMVIIDVAARNRNRGANETSLEMFILARNLKVRNNKIKLLNWEKNEKFGLFDKLTFSARSQNHVTFEGTREKSFLHPRLKSVRARGRYTSRWFLNPSTSWEN